MVCVKYGTLETVGLYKVWGTHVKVWPTVYQVSNDLKQSSLLSNVEDVQIRDHVRVNKL